jgi:hypothetical protein
MQQHDVDLEADEPKDALERIADVLEAIYDPERKALRLYDVERSKVYQAALSPEYREKFGMTTADKST